MSLSARVLYQFTSWVARRRRPRLPKLFIAQWNFSSTSEWHFTHHVDTSIRHISVKVWIHIVATLFSWWRWCAEFILTVYVVNIANHIVQCKYFQLVSGSDYSSILVGFLWFYLNLFYQKIILRMFYIVQIFGIQKCEFQNPLIPRRTLQQNMKAIRWQ